MVRKRVIKPSKGKSFRGKTIFLKTRTAIHWESTLERDLVRLADYDPQVVDIEHQPFCLEYCYCGRKRTYNPDYKLSLLVSGILTILVVEVKLLKRVNDAKNLVKYEVGRRYCRDMGWEYRILTEEQLRPGKYFQQNLKMLRGLGNEMIPEEYVQYVFSKLQQLGSSSIYELKARCVDLQDESSFYASLYKLLYFQKIHADIVNEKLTDFVIVSSRRRTE